MDKILTCKYSKCNKYYINPISLPCGNNICEDHLYDLVDEDGKFKCVFCDDEHETPEHGFLINNDLNELLNLGLHLNDDQKKGMELLTEVQSFIEDFDLLNRDPENYLYDYFSNIKNMIDKERERLKLKIDLISDDMLSELKVFEDECKSSYKDSNSQNKIELEQLKANTSNWKNELRSPNINEKRLKKLIDEMSTILDENQNKVSDYEKILLRGKECHFAPKNLDFSPDLFGEFIITSKITLCESLSSPTGRLDLSDSYILVNEQDKLLRSLCQFDENIKFKLIYKASRDGFSAENFHSKCDGFQNTLTIIKVKDSSNIFGGYTTAAWDSSNTNKKDEHAFIFSLVNKENKPVKINIDQTKVKYAIECNASYGPIFGADDFLVASNSNQSKASYSNLGNSYKHPFYGLSSSKARCFLSGTYTYSTTEIEVYQKVAS